MNFIIAALIIVFLVSVGVYFVITDHPWFALMMFLMAASVRVKEIIGDNEDEN